MCTLPCRLVNMQNLFGFAPLQYAAWSKQPAVVQVLLQYGADMLIKNPRAGTEHSILCAAGSTPLHLAAFRGHIEISRILLKTFYERFLEPMLLAQAGTGVDAATITRSVRANDPRTQVNALNLLPHQVAHRLGFLALSMLLKPNIPILRLFSEDERAVRLYGPPQLKVLCAEALNRKLLAALEQLSNNPPPKPKLPVTAIPAPAAVTLAQPPPQPPSSPHPPLLQPRTSMQHGRHPSNSLPTVPEADDEMTTTTNMSRDMPANPSFTRCARTAGTYLAFNGTLGVQQNDGAPQWGGSQEELQAMFVPPNAVQQQQQQLVQLQEQQKQANLDGTSPVHSLVENVVEAPSLDLWQYPEQPRSSPTMPKPGPSPFAAMAAAPPSRASLETTSQHTAPTPHRAHTTSTVSSGGAAAPPEPCAVLSSAAAAAAAAAHVGPKAAGGPHPIATRLPGQATSSCEQNTHAGRAQTIEGADSSSLLLPTPPARSGTSSPVPVLHSGGGAVAQPQEHSSTTAQASHPATAAAAASSLLHSPTLVHRGDASAYACLLGSNNASVPVPTTNQGPSQTGVPSHACLSLPTINVTRPTSHPAHDNALPSKDSPASHSNPHALHFRRHSSVHACPENLPFSGPQGYCGSGSGTVTFAPEHQRLSALQSTSRGARLETATSNPIPGQEENSTDTASQLYRSASTATNGDNTVPNSPPAGPAGVPGNAPSTGRSGSGISGLFRTSSPLRSTSPFQRLRRRNSPPGRTGGVTDPGAGPGPSTSQAAVKNAAV
ncbi:hypothetical protein DUNSADRAFT_4899 [Dunaliella salina]|uniref:Uncharacterized protein n=1 Tax=Dunaliella salina TaxID=3046 RepID=A0ABQ7GR28_DUNSA|nr:hypothetical protein DUNSADRAFT_4899 [Dunaliella salina]|eukprot:KAF5837066.1 hypothetical protein DUNSADRAFT_4899 [Dunaliella salina]